MADVVEIARSRRARLVVEIARLDDFIQMAEQLLQYEDGPIRGSGKSEGAGDLEPLHGDRRAGDGGSPQGDARERAPTGAAGGGSGGDAEIAEPSAKARPDHGRPAADGEPGSGDPAADARLDAEVGQRLRQRRWMIGLTKKQVADRLGIGVEEIQDYEEGRKHISNGRMWHLAAALEVPMSYFFGETAEQAGGDRARAEAPRLTRQTELARTA